MKQPGRFMIFSKYIQIAEFRELGLDRRETEWLWFIQKKEQRTRETYYMTRITDPFVF